MSSIEPLQMMPLMNETDAPLGRDTGQDNACFWAAVAMFSLTGVAVIAVAGVWLALRERPETQVRNLFERENTAVVVDMPTLRPHYDDGDDEGPGPGSFTFLDEANGVHELVEVVPPARLGAAASGTPTFAR
ncbi:hypothetical protein [Ancylobacter amanitiformis]|uniref:Uncharacterized protein n=1 Tax=Ancylobacter amanitiformis TaxID=217069 RepID=A0ABU0LRL7_9HYPH|nr:hypothetical protein [Ancylobacter amanitiformis]MDQ0511331.1 hypothetical protein [Ancylobacter amanitiformis]